MNAEYWDVLLSRPVERSFFPPIHSNKEVTYEHLITGFRFGSGLVRGRPSSALVMC